MAEVLNIFQATPEPARASSSFELDKLTEQFKQQRPPPTAMSRWKSRRKSMRLPAARAR
jgi:hypothetical protein